MPQVVFTEQTGRVLTVRFDDPPRNFLGSRMVAELDALTRRLENDRSIGAVILTGAVPDVFVTHADTAEISRRAEAVGWAPTYRQTRTLAAVVGPMGRIPPARRTLERTRLAGVLSLRRAYEVFARMSRLDKVFIAAINGLAIGGGCVLSLACDIRLMANDDDHRIGLPEGALGFIAAAGGTQRCARLIGPGRTLYLLLDGRLLNPSEAVEIGLVNWTVPAADLLPAAEELAERLARRSPLAVREIKRCVYDGGSRRFSAGLRVEEASMLATVSSAASLRALAAYHAELGPMDATGNDDVTAAWDRLHDGNLVDMTAP